MYWIKDEQQRFAIHLHIPWILERFEQEGEVHLFIFDARIGLFDEQLVGCRAIAVPVLGIPGVVSPTKTEGEVRFA